MQSKTLPHARRAGNAVSGDTALAGTSNCLVCADDGARVVAPGPPVRVGRAADPVGGADRGRPGHRHGATTTGPASWAFWRAPASPRTPWKVTSAWPAAGRARGLRPNCCAPLRAWRRKPPTAPARSAPPPSTAIFCRRVCGATHLQAPQPDNDHARGCQFVLSHHRHDPGLCEASHAD
jgi:hypothetical protein